MLNDISRVLLQPNKKEIIVFKIFQLYKGNFFSICKPYNQKLESHLFFKFAPIGEWTSCYCDYDKNEWPDIKLHTLDTNEEYPTGFHCYLDLSSAQVNLDSLQNYHLAVICKCVAKYRMIFGNQKSYKYCFANWSKVVVCRGLKILEMLQEKKNDS